MNLTIAWTNPTPYPGCDFKASYRRKGDSAYTVLDASGTTSGSTVTTFVPAPANYEGYSQGNCCDDNLSTGDPFGINSYVELSIDISIATEPLRYLATITSAYGNSYDTIISGSYKVNDTPMNYQVTYPANNTTATIVITGTPPSNAAVISDITVDDIDPQFANGGTLQQFDGVRTPPYFAFYYDTSGTTFNGDVASLPSFTIDQFNITEQNESLTILSGDILISWIQSALYNSGVSPWNVYSFEVYDPTPTLLGTVLFNAAPVGLRGLTMSINKGLGYPIADNTLLTLKVYNAADTLIGQHNFYLPFF